MGSVLTNFGIVSSSRGSADRGEVKQVKQALTLMGDFIYQCAVLVEELSKQPDAAIPLKQKYGAYALSKHTELPINNIRDS